MIKNGFYGQFVRRQLDWMKIVPIQDNFLMTSVKIDVYCKARCTFLDFEI